MLTAQSILDTLAQQQSQLHAMGVERLGLFGSYVRGEAGAESDLDFLVRLSPTTFDTYMNLKFYLEDLFGLPVDLVTEGSLRPRLRERILQEVQYVWKVFPV